MFFRTNRRWPCVDVGQAVVGTEEILENDWFGVVRQENNFRTAGGEVRNQPLDGHVPGPKPFEGDDGEIGRHGDAGMEGVT